MGALAGLPSWWLAWPFLTGLRVRCPRKCHIVAKAPPRPETNTPLPTDDAIEGLCEDLGGLKCKHRQPRGGRGER